MATREELKQVFANGQMATGEKFANLIDSMKVVQLPVVDPQALGTSLSFIDSISQDADGKITATKKTLDLANAHELNPFKGWWKTGDTLPTDGFDGAYLYFKDTSELTGQTTIYRWNGTAYADTGTVVDTSNVQTFGSGQQLNAVKIMDETGEEVQGTADVLSAEAGEMLGNKTKLFQGKTSQSANLVNPSELEIGYLGNTPSLDTALLSGGSNDNYHTTPAIPVKPLTKYTCWGNTNTATIRRVIFYKNDGSWLSRTDNSDRVFETPQNAAYMRFSSGNETAEEDYKKWGVIEGDNVEFETWRTERPYTAYNAEGGGENILNKEEDEIATIKDLEDIGLLNVGKKLLHVTIDEDKIAIVDSKNIKLECTLEYNGVLTFSDIENFWSNSKSSINDDVAPIHIMNTTIGAKHGMPMYKATITGHGLTNTAIGSAWTKDNYTYYIMKIIDEDNILFLSENVGNSNIDQNRVPLSLSSGSSINSDTYGAKSISAVTTYQVRPWTNNVRHVLLADGRVVNYGSFYCDNFQIVESYKIKDTQSVLENTIDRLGSAVEQDWEGDSIFRINNVYGFDGSLTCTIASDYTPISDIAFVDIMGLQSQSKYESGVNTVGIYIPNTNPITIGNESLNFNEVYVLNANNSDNWTFDNATYKDAQNPPNRLVRIWPTYERIFATGWLPSNDAYSANLTDEFLTKATSNKFYFHPINSDVINSPITVGNVYSIIGYRVFCDKPNNANKIAKYYVRYGGFTYIFVDYSETVSMDFITIDDNRGIEGKEIEVVQSVHTTLVSDRYISGFYVNADKIVGEPCFIVVKVRNS